MLIVVVVDTARGIDVVAEVAVRVGAVALILADDVVAVVVVVVTLDMVMVLGLIFSGRNGGHVGGNSGSS